jgi:serine/threonine protein kinase
MSNPSAGGSNWQSDSRRSAPAAGRLGRFGLIAAVGRGAFGEVWRAHDPQLDRDVALKLPRFDDAAGKEAQRFFREARAAAQLQHPNIVPVHEAGEIDGRCYIASKFIDGLPLSVWMQQNAVKPSEAATLVQMLAAALHYAHGRGVIHRDVKPANVMMDAAGEPHVMDFGLARRPEDEATLTTEGSVLGTPSYMAPEQAVGRSHLVDARSDLYALGVVLYELLAGRKPFDGPPHAVLHQVVHDAPPPIRKLRPRVPADLETVCLKCLEKDPARRYADCAALAEDLRRILAREPILARPVGPLGRARRWCARNPIMAGIAAALTVVGLLVLALSVALASSLTRKPDLGPVAGTPTKSMSSPTAATQPQGPAQSPLEIKQFRGHTGPIWGLAVSADGQRAVTCAGRKPGSNPAPNTDNSVRAWDMSTGQQLWSFRDHTDTVSSVGITADGKRAVSGSHDRTVRVWDLEKGKLLYTMTGHTNRVTGVAVIPDTARAVSVSLDGELRVWNLDNGSSVNAFPLNLGELTCVALAPAGDRVYCGTQKGLVQEVDLATGNVLRPFDAYGTPAYQVLPSPDGAFLTATTVDMYGVICATADGRQRGIVFQGRAMCYSPDGGRALVAARDFSVGLYPSGSSQLLARLLGHTDHPQGLAILPDGERALSVSWDGTFRMWRIPPP